MVNTTGMMMLHHSAILQIYDHFTEVVQSQELRLDKHDLWYATVEDRVAALETASEILAAQIQSLGLTPEV